MHNIGGYVSSNLASVGTAVDAQSRAILLSHLNKQAFIHGINDDFLLAAIFSLISIIPVIFLHGRKKKNSPAVPKIPHSE